MSFMMIEGEMTKYLMRMKAESWENNRAIIPAHALSIIPHNNPAEAPKIASSSQSSPGVLWGQHP